MPKAVIFDLDDTLYDRAQFLASGFAAVADSVSRTHGIPAHTLRTTLHLAHADERNGSELQALCAWHGLSEDLIPEWIGIIREHEPLLTPARGAVTMLASMRAQGWRVGLLTNGLPATQRAKVRALALEPLVDAVVCAEDVVAGGKPARPAFDAAMASVGARRSRTVFVGDDLARDIHGAQAAGLHTIRVAAAPVVRATRDAQAVVTHLEDVPAAAAALLKGAAYAA
jgi:putative hydrolase of the HAD superfamily